MMKRILATLAFVLAGTFGLGTALAQPVMGDEVVENSDFTLFNSPSPGSSGWAATWYTPQNWTCQNFPRLNAACGYDRVGATVSIRSAPVGLTPTARMTWPINPTWYQGIQVQLPGTYFLEVEVTKVQLQATNGENYAQAVVIKDGLTPILNVPHAQLPVGVKTTIRVPVTFASAGAHSLFVGLATRTPNGTMGHRFDFHKVSITYAGY